MNMSSMNFNAAKLRYVNTKKLFRTTFSQETLCAEESRG